MPAMPPAHPLRSQLDDWLTQVGLKPLADTLCAPGSPVALVGAQLLYLSAPMLSPFVDMAAVNELAADLERFESDEDAAT